MPSTLTTPESPWCDAKRILKRIFKVIQFKVNANTTTRRKTPALFSLFVPLVIVDEDNESAPFHWKRENWDNSIEKLL